MPISNLSPTLLSAAEAYLALSYAVIPLYGDTDPARPKAPAVAWSGYQKTRPSLDQCRSWFLEDGFAALGIVTGAVSRLAVLDFDTADAFHRFQSRFPELAERQVIQTRRGFHIYYQLPPNFRLSSRKGQGIDLLAEGCYAVARPSVIAGHAYQLIRGGQPRPLSLGDIQHILTFMGDNLTTATPQPASSQQSAVSPHDPVLPTHPSSVIPQTFLSTYRARIGKGAGRNTALFQAGLAARDAGLPLEQALDLFAGAHAAQRPAIPHLPESPQARHWEAFQTIRSVYSRPPRAVTIRPVVQAGLPNTAREALFRLRCTHVVRLWEGLRLKGIAPGAAFTAETACSLLKGIVGRDSIYNALNAVSEGGEALFEREIPSGHPKASGDAAADTEQETPKKCIFGRAEKPGIIQKGRKTRVFILPDALDFCRKLGLKPAPSDPLTLDDISSARGTRMAAHRELIRRRPGIYPRRWLAKRLGICVETLDSYNHAIPINTRPQYIETRLYWSNLRAVPDGMEIGGAFLEDESGKRYPARRPLAAKLLSRGKSVTYKRQDANYYWYGDEPPDIAVRMGFHARRDELEANMARIKQFMAAHPAGQGGEGVKPSPPAPATQPRLIPAERDPRPATTLARTRHSPSGQAVSGRRRLKDERLEALANRVYEQVNRRSPDPALHISLAVARRLVSGHASAQVETALVLLDGRRNVAKPAGFFISALRAEAKRR